MPIGRNCLNEKIKKISQLDSRGRHFRRFGVFFRFALIGYDFIGYALLFTAAVIAAYKFLEKCSE